MRLLRTAVVTALLTATPLAVAGASTASASPNHRASRAPVPVGVATVHGHSDLPADAPAALYRAEPQLPRAKGWPAGNGGFPRTSGTGRLDDGGYYWTDFLYDDHGTTTASTGGLSVTAGTPSFGTYTYPAGAAHNNGADIFRAAVYRGSHATYWRVDWNTLASPRVPIAEWTFDRDNNAATGGSTWPGDAGVHSPGIDTALLVSSRGAQLIRVSTGAVLAHLHTTVGRAAHSFVVRVPDRMLRPTGTWRIRLAAGLADGSGTGFAPAADALPTQTRVYNVTFRSTRQEPQSDDYWDDQAQTRALATGDVSAFSRVVRWAQLALRLTTRPAAPRGWSDRWYVSDVRLGPGIVTDAASISDTRPNYLGRVQPYAVYVPTSYRAGHPAPLTFLLHSSTQNQNQYVATTPKFSRLACQDRHSICVTTLGRGPDGDFFDYAELDFWQVWHAVAAAYDLDPNRTVLSGYSMGGIGTNQLAMAHPDLFARAVTLAGGVGNLKSLVNLRYVPTYLAGGAEDELVPVTVQHGEAAGLQALGDRFRWLLYPAIDHVTYELADSFGDPARYMGHSSRVRNPGSFTYTWSPTNTTDAFDPGSGSNGGLPWTQLHRYGVGTTGDYWVRDLKARNVHKTPKIVARSGMRPVRTVFTHVSTGLDVNGGPEPGVATQLTWTRGKPSSRSAVLVLTLQDVRTVRVLLRAAGFAPGESGSLIVRSDGPVHVRLGTRTYRLGAGRHTVDFVTPGRSLQGAVAVPPLPTI